jgi:hypothetical protein
MIGRLTSNKWSLTDQKSSGWLGIQVELEGKNGSTVKSCKKGKTGWLFGRF